MEKNDCVFETQRLVGKSWNRNLAKEAFQIYGDPDVTRFIGGAAVANLDEMRTQIDTVIKKYENLPKGMGSFPVHLKSTGSLVGTALLKPLPDVEGEFTDEIEIGWHLSKRTWGRGYATEFGKKLLELGFENFELDKLHAVVEPSNEKSKKVAERLGMQYVGTVKCYYEGTPVEHFVMSREEFDANRSRPSTR